MEEVLLGSVLLEAPHEHHVAVKPAQLLGGEVEVEGSTIYHKTEYRERRDHYAFYHVNSDIIGFDTGLHYQRQTERFDQRVQWRDLAAQFVRHRWSVGFVIRVHVIAEGLAAGIKYHRDMFRLMLLHQLFKHGNHTIRRAGRLAFAIGQRWQRMEGTCAELCGEYHSLMLFNVEVVSEAEYEDYIDSDVLETIEDYRVAAAERDVQLNVIGLRDEYQLNDPIQFVPTLDKETQTRLQPEDVLQLLRDGNERFKAGRWIKKYYLHQADHRVRLEPGHDTLLKQALVAFTLHSASRPRNEITAWTINLQEPRVNLFLTGDNLAGATVDLAQTHNQSYNVVLDGCSISATATGCVIYGSPLRRNCPWWALALNS